MSEPISAIPALAAPQGGGLAGVVPSPAPAPAPASVAVAQPDTSVAKGGLEDAVHALQQQAAAAGAELEFSIDEELGRVIVILRDARDGTVLRQIPGEEVLRIARMLREDPGPLVQAVV